MKTYTVEKHHGCNLVEVSVNVPTPKELQKTTILGENAVVVSNFSFGGIQKFAVARFTLETDQSLIALGITLKLPAVSIWYVDGDNSRSDVVDMAANYLLGR